MNEVEKVLDKIKKLRKICGFSHQYMAQELGISQVAYSKIEKNKTTLSVDRLLKIVVILQTDIINIFDVNSKTTDNQNSNNLTTLIQFQNLYQENKENKDKIEILYEERLKDKESTIIQLQEIIKRIAPAKRL